MEWLLKLNEAIAAAFSLCYAYQLIYLLVSLFKRVDRDSSEETVLHRYAVLISARNEENVLPCLIKSIQDQDYPSELVDIYVVADNCTDNTANSARDAGAIVYERCDKKHIGKGYALKYLWAELPKHKYDGYFVLDADNILDRAYVSEMNKTFSKGYKIVTSYRNSKNFGENWISAAYSIYFMRESRFLNEARMTLGVSCCISGTGFLVHHEIFDRSNGWNWFSLSEDTEFTLSSVIEGERIAYCPTAMLYDEQPVSFVQSIRQRLRWAKGSIQAYRLKGADLIKRLLKTGDFACFDMAMAIIPAIIVSFLSMFISFGGFIWAVVTPKHDMIKIVEAVLGSLGGAYIIFLLLGAVTVIGEWRNIHCVWYKKIMYSFAFPLFMITCIPIAIAAIFMKVEWKPIKHHAAKSLEDIIN